MKVRPKIVLDVQRIETGDQARRVDIFPKEIPPKGWDAFIGDYLVKGPVGTFIAPAATFDQDYEVIDPV